MPATLVLGLQWGDEGKGKIVDLLSENADFVVRSQGGANSGHTVVVDGVKHKLHCVPSGILRPSVKCVLGRGMVVDPLALKREFEELAAKGVDYADRVIISPRVHLVLPHHKLLDVARERVAGRAKIGTTGRGIGPCYAEKANRTGVQMGDLLYPDVLAVRVRHSVTLANELLSTIYGEEPVSVDSVIADLMGIAPFFSPLIGETSQLLIDAYKAGKQILFEGAQAVMLDIDAGTYPYVTSSTTIAAGASTGSGFPFGWIDKTIGVSKAYCTRVGLGPFPSEAHGETSDYLRQRGAEFGTSTGRPRRTGWIDLVALRYSIVSNLVDEVFLTKLDVLGGLPSLKLCVAYQHNGKTYETVPEDPVLYSRLTPVFKEMDGWNEEIGDCTAFDELPKQAQRFVREIAEQVGVPISTLSVGPERNQKISITC
ncbi:MAG: adenylosuccinate synthase [Planctomycetota bacterium]